MKLDKHVVDMFTELTKPADDVKMEKTCYGTISVVDGTRYVKLDGSDLLVPAASTVKTSHGDRVTVLMKNHSLTVTGNLTAPATDGEGGSSGEAGTAATIEVGTVTTGEAGSSAAVTNSGTKSEAIFDFVIPRGDKGEKGDTGPQGPQGEKGDTGTWDGTIPDHEHAVSDITDFPTSLPANGGNADTLDGKHAIDFFNNIAGLISPETSGKATLVEYINTLDSATSNFYASEFDDLPTNNWGYNVTVYKAGGAVYVIAYKALSNREIYVRNFTVSGEWNGDWTRLNDGGNADTVDDKHASDFVQKSGDSMSGNLRMETNQLWFGVGGISQFYFEDTYGDLNLKNHDGTTIFAANYGGSYATHADTLDGLHANEIASNPNLLINPDFKINQRGKSEYTAAGYTVDRWAAQSNCKVTPKSSGGVRLDCLGTVNTGFYQKYDGDLSGNTVTLSLKASGSGSLRLGVWDTSIKIVTLDDTPRVYSHTFELGDDPTFGMWLSANGEYAEIEWTKFEIGSIATPFVPPEATIELLKCRRYYQKLCFFRVPMAYHDVNYITWFIPFVPMRTLPTVTINTDGMYLDGMPRGSQPTDFAVAWAAGTDPTSASGCIRVNCSYSSSWETSIANGSWNVPLTANSNNGGLLLDAEL